MTEWVLEATGLGRDFRQGPTTLTVLRDLEVRIARGERVAIVDLCRFGQRAEEELAIPARLNATVEKRYERVRHGRWSEYQCQPPHDAVFIGLQEYRLSRDGTLMPLYDTKQPPDLRYFNPRPSQTR